jgi:hypothetical protein
LRGADVQDVGFEVPGVRVGFEVGCVGFEVEGAIFVHHANQAGAARPTIQPQQNRVVIWVFLRVEEHVVEGTYIVVE